MEAEHANKFYQMLQPFVHLFRADVVPTFLAIALAWVSTPRQQRTSNFLRTLGPERSRHQATYYRFFANSQWFTDSLSLGLFYLLLPIIGLDAVIRIAIDDTLLKHSGRRVFGASMFRDAVLSTQSRVVTRWGLNCIVLSLSLPHPLYPNEFVSIPLMARLFSTQERCDEHSLPYQSPSELAMDMVYALYLNAPKTLQWRLIGDGAFTNQHIFEFEIPRLHFTGRIRSDAALQRPVETRKYAGVGAYPSYGLGYPKPTQMIEDRRRKRHFVTFPGYGGRSLKREVVELLGTYKEIAGNRRLRFLLVIPPKGEPLFLVTTDLSSPLAEILVDFVSRWSIEVAFRETKQLMGVEKSQVWSEASVRRMAPFGFWLVGMVKVWYLHLEPKLPKLRLKMPWYRPQGRTSFAQMLGTLRYCIWKTVLEDDEGAHEISGCVGLPQDSAEKQDWILRLFSGC